MNETIKTIKNKSAAVDKFEGKINKTTIKIGSHKRSKEFLKDFEWSLYFEKK